MVSGLALLPCIKSRCPQCLDYVSPGGVVVWNIIYQVPGSIFGEDCLPHRRAANQVSILILSLRYKLCGQKLRDSGKETILWQYISTCGKETINRPFKLTAANDG